MTWKPGDLARNKACGKTVRILEVLPELLDEGFPLIDEPCARVEDVPTEPDSIDARLRSVGFSGYTPLSNLEPIA